MSTGVPVDRHLVVPDQVLTVVEVFERGTDPIGDRVQADELAGDAETAVASGRKTSPSCDQFFVSSARQ